MRVRVLVVVCLSLLLCSVSPVSASVSGPSMPDATPAKDEVANEAQGELESTCTAAAECWDHSLLICTGTQTCTAEDANCWVNFRGWVSCDGVTTYCDICQCPNEGEKCTSDADCLFRPYPFCEFCWCENGKCACP
jgi:hypothetical protein